MAYFADTMTINAQKINESTPRTESGVGAPPA